MFFSPPRFTLGHEYGRPRKTRMGEKNHAREEKEERVRRERETREARMGNAQGENGDEGWNLC